MDGLEWLFEGLSETVSSAMYWQEPDETDRELARPEAREWLTPVAEAICASPAARWWSSPMERVDQYEVALAKSSGDFPDPAGENGRAALEAWRAAAIDRERQAAPLPDEPGVMITGVWWSTPAHAGLLHTTRRVPGHGPVGMYLVEDSLRWTWARCWSVRVASGARVYEVNGPQDWVELVARYPLVITEGRRHDWRRVTGQDSAWVIPDFLAVASDYDAIHLSVAGYLSTAGRALAVGDEHTVLAGWSPEETWWLNDRPARVGDGVRWGQGLGPELAAWAPS